MPHEANAPDFSGQRAQSGPDLDVVFREQCAADGGFIHAIRHIDGIEHGEPAVGGHEHGEPQFFESADQGLVAGHVPLIHLVGPLFQDQPEGLIQTVMHVDGSSVMVGPGGPFPVLHDQGQVQVPVGHLGFSILQGFDRFVRKGERGQSGGTGEAFLGAAVKGIDAPIVHLDVQAPEAGDGVHEIDRVRPLEQCADLFHGIFHAGGGLGVDDGDDLVGLFGDLGLYPVDRHGLAPFKRHGVDIGAQAFGHILHPGAEHPVDKDEHRVAFFDEVDKTRFHAGGPGAGHGDRQSVPGVEQGPEIRLDGVHDPDEVGVEMAQGLFSERRIDAVVDAGGPGPHEEDFFNAVE